MENVELIQYSSEMVLNRKSLRKLCILATKKDFPDLIMQNNLFYYKTFTEKKSLFTLMSSLNLRDLTTILIDLCKILEFCHELGAYCFNFDLKQIFYIENQIRINYPISFSDDVNEKKLYSENDKKNFLNFILNLLDFPKNYSYLFTDVINYERMCVLIEEKSVNNENLNFFKSSLPKIINENLDSQIFSELINDFQEILKKLSLNVEFSCVFCKKAISIDGSKYLEFENCTHKAHISCFNENLLIVSLKATSLQRLYCPGDDSAKCNFSKYPKKCKKDCPNFCSCKEKKNCECEIFVCKCKNGIECKFASKSKTKCYCQSIDICRCEKKCWCKPFGINFFKKNKDKIIYSILRRVNRIELRSRRKVFECKKCNHSQNVFALNEKLKSYQCTCNCGGPKFCSFCLNPECNGKKCLLLKKSLVEIEDLN